MLDINELKQKNNIVDVVSRYIDLSPHAGEMRGLCCFHDEKSPSLMVNDRKQIFKCYGCGKGGDVIDFLVNRGLTFKDALKELSDPSNISADNFEKQAARKVAPIVVWKDATPSEPCLKISHYSYGLPSKTWAYRNAQGKVIGYACRFDLPGEKMVLPFTFKTDGTQSEWRWQGFDKPRPLYNLNKIIEDQNKTVLIVEGEKTADAAAKFFPHVTVTCWMGGASGIKSIDLTPLYGRKIVYWPDNDYTHAYKDNDKAGQIKPFHEQPGNNAMLSISELLGDKCPVQKWVKNPEGAPCGWDVADASDWTPEQALTYLRANLIDVPVFVKEESPIIPPAPLINDLPKQIVKYDVPPIPNDEDDEPEHIVNSWFKCLGYDKAESGGQHYYFYAYSPKTVIKLSPSAMSKSNLMQLAPLNWWESKFHGNKGMSTDAAQNFLVNRCHDVGIFNEKWIRGRGAWIDKKDIVIHAGSHLIVNGQPKHFKDFKSKYIYEIGEEMEFDTEQPLQNKEANKLVDVLSLLNFDREIELYFLAGWCVVAPVCGALNWRPHLWLTGAAGAGKTWVTKHLIRAMLGETALAVQGVTTEAGLRQTLGHDALPVVFDEADGNDKRSQDRMQDVLSLMRSASSHDGGVMAKGSAIGSAKTYRIRSCFLFSSISIQIKQQSDRTRVSTVSLKSYKENDPRRAARWAELQKLYVEVITDDFCKQLRARTISILPIILENSKMFSAAAASVLGEQRAGDQVGSLLAGAYSLSSSKLITYEAAVAWVKAKDWTEEKALETTKDEMRLFSFLMSQLIRIENTALGTQERTVGELVMVCLKIKSDITLTEDAANDKLKRIGMRVKDGYIYIANSEPAILQMVKDTAWSNNHGKILKRIEGAEDVASTTFAAGMKSRAVRIKSDGLFNDSN